jgi:ferredoxin
MSAKLSVDESRCTGHGRCYTVAPKLLTDDDEGFVTLRGRG